MTPAWTRRSLLVAVLGVALLTAAIPAPGVTAGLPAPAPASNGGGGGGGGP
jgi:hypothetical protein